MIIDLMLPPHGLETIIAAEGDLLSMLFARWAIEHLVAHAIAYAIAALREVGHG
jgi:hypothetical protein